MAEHFGINIKVENKEIADYLRNAKTVTFGLVENLVGKVSKNSRGAAYEIEKVANTTGETGRLRNPVIIRRIPIGIVPPNPSRLMVEKLKVVLPIMVWRTSNFLKGQIQTIHIRREPQQGLLPI